MLRFNAFLGRLAQKGGRAAAVVCFTLALGSAQAAPVAIAGRVVYVDDGDTVILRTATADEVNIRLSSIDAPEVSHVKREQGRYGQPFGQASKRFLATLVDQRDVKATCFEQDRYGRQDCELFVNGRSVNRAMVAAGMAWANMAARGRYMRDPTVPDLEREARRQSAGLWAEAHPVAPWEWRVVCWRFRSCAGTQ